MRPDEAPTCRALLPHFPSPYPLDLMKLWPPRNPDPLRPLHTYIHGYQHTYVAVKSARLLGLRSLAISSPGSYQREYVLPLASSYGIAVGGLYGRRIPGDS